MVEFREMAKQQAEAARAGDKEAQQKRVYYQGTLDPIRRIISHQADGRRVVIPVQPSP